MILALETSCDDTCAAVVTRAGEIRSNVVSSQAVHGRFGGVVPEWASRHHLEHVNAIVDQALQEAGATLDDVELIAVTQGPGLVGALLIGVATAKGLAASRRLPLAAVDHLQGHVAANFLEDGFEPPFICLLACGGHTLLARVTDARRLRDARPDAGRRRGRGVRQGRAAARPRLPGRAGAVEAGARGRPDGVRVPDRVARRRAGLLVRGPEDRAALQGPRPRPGGDGAPRRRPRRVLRARDRRGADRAASERALEAEHEPRLAIGGGVAANRLLRERALALGVPVHVPPHALCTDNAAMIASAARWVEPQPFPDYLALDAYATRRAA